MATPEPTSLTTGLPNLQSPTVENALAAAVAANLAAQEANSIQHLEHIPQEQTSPPKTGGRDKGARKSRLSESSSKRNENSKRKYICSFSHYGCDTSLSSKNEWKRHVAIQHLQLGFYRCDVGSCNPENIANTPSNKKVFNDFNRKDLFTQHQRRMHKPAGMGDSAVPNDSTSADWRIFEESLEEVRQRCWHEKRRPPMRSTCGFCGRVFEGDGSWNERMEHVGGHYARDLPENCQEEREDEDLTNWALQEGIIRETPTGQNRLVDQPPTSNDRSDVNRNIDTSMIDGQADNEDLTGAYPPLNGTGRPGSSSGQNYPSLEAFCSDSFSDLNWSAPVEKEDVSNGSHNTDRLEDLINTLINPKKPRMTKRLQWKCDCGLDNSVDFVEDNADDERAFRSLGRISIVCKNSQSPFMKTGSKGQYIIIRCNELATHIAREGKRATEHSPSNIVDVDGQMQEGEGETTMAEAPALAE